jgi:hypothetical protein
MAQAMQGSDLPAVVVVVVVVVVAIHRNGERISYASGKAIWDAEAGWPISLAKR